jgi:hypothetical protein
MITNSITLFVATAAKEQRQGQQMFLWLSSVFAANNTPPM